MSFLIPGINVFDVDKNLLNKMFPLSFFSTDYDLTSTCCSKFNTCYLNFKNLSFSKIGNFSNVDFDIYSKLMFYDYHYYNKSESDIMNRNIRFAGYNG